MAGPEGDAASSASAANCGAAPRKSAGNANEKEGR